MTSSVFILLVYASVALGARILLIPFDHHAHVNYHSVIGAELKSRGHQVDIIVADRSEKIPQGYGINTITVKQDVYWDFTKFEKAAESTLELINMLGGLQTVAETHVRRIVTDATLMKQLKSNSYDLAITDAAVVVHSIYIIPHKLGVKYMGITPMHYPPWVERLPVMPSVESFPPLFYFDKDTQFYERFLNFMFCTAMTLMQPAMAPSDSLLDELVPEQPNIGMQGLHSNSQMTLSLMDPYCSDQHRVSAPHVQLIGGLGAHDSDVLPPNLKKVMDSSKDGVIVFTLGSGLKRLPMDMLTKVLLVFKELKQNVIIRHDGEIPRDVPKNVHIEKWLPQNNLLAHSKTKVFITHCGNNGQLEGVYHGVPMLMLPHLGDQFYNARRATKKNYGLTLDAHQFTVEQFNDTIRELLQNPMYSNAIKKCSAILHSMDPAKKKAAFWIEHVLQFGGDHLKPYYIDMPLWKFFMLDVLAVCIVIDGLAISALYKCIRCCCFRGKPRKTEFMKNKNE